MHTAPNLFCTDFDPADVFGGSVRELPEVPEGQVLLLCIQYLT